MTAAMTAAMTPAVTAARKRWRTSASSGSYARSPRCSPRATRCSSGLATTPRSWRARTAAWWCSTDLHVDTRHFRRDWATAEEIGHKVAAANLSDINAMGGRATALTVGLAAPADLPVSWATGLARGIADECALVGRLGGRR